MGPPWGQCVNRDIKYILETTYILLQHIHTKKNTDDIEYYAYNFYEIG